MIDQLSSRFLPFVLPVALLMTAVTVSSVQAQEQAAHNSAGFDPTNGKSEALIKKLHAAYKARGADYNPRTEHFNENGDPLYTNRLILEDSPYLLQHAHNPVDWYPWGAEAFEQSRLQDKPIFLSIGYATCHWCHVMERESFESEEIARQMNESYIAVKVDREQLPDVDATYMTAVQMLTGGGGWPMSTFLQGEGKPFHGGTYMPPEIFSQTLAEIINVWDIDNSRVQDFATRLSDAIAESNRVSGEARSVGEAEFAAARDTILSSHDDLQGGFGGAPKFPREPSLFFLLDLAQRNADEAALEAANFTLQRISAGGIHDQIAGGFHRYAVDNDWLTPHFEKMLYNQAALSRVYLQAHALTGDTEHLRTARRTLDYVIREMTNEDGGFYSATDADSEGGEGLFFIWTPEELTEVLGKEDAELAMMVWGVTEEGNFEERNILHMDGPIRDVARVHQLDPAELTARLGIFSEKLLEERIKREPPLTDRKVISEWNGMMITAFTEGYDLAGDPRYLEAAINAAEFVWDKNYRGDGSLYRAHFNGNSSIEASQSDYAFMAEAMLALYDTTGDQRWLERVEVLTATMLDKFWDTESGGFFMGDVTASGAALPSRPKDLFDNATPTGNSVALRVFTKLWYRTGDIKHRESAEALLASFSGFLELDGSAFGYLLIGANELLNGESGDRLFAARGKVKAEARIRDNQVEVLVDVAPGWHINAEKPLQDYLIGTRLTDAEDKPLSNVVYPQAKKRVLGFQRAELALYEGKVKITAALPEDNTVSVQLQACSDEICLAPETLTLRLASTGS